MPGVLFLLPAVLPMENITHDESGSDERKRGCDLWDHSESILLCCRIIGRHRKGRWIQYRGPGRDGGITDDRCVAVRQVLTVLPYNAPVPGV